MCPQVQTCFSYIELIKVACFCLLMFLEDNFSDQSSYFDMNVLFYLAVVDWYVVNVDVQEA